MESDLAIRYVVCANSWVMVTSKLAAMSSFLKFKPETKVTSVGLFYVSDKWPVFHLELI